MSVLWALFFVCFNSWGQRGSVNSELDNEALAISSNHYGKTYFKRTVLFARQENWDSVLLYSAKSLSSDSRSELRDFIHYYRGEAFLKKKLPKQALSELNVIHRDFPFFFKAELKKGEIFLEKRQFQKALDAFGSIDTNNAFHCSNVTIDGVQHNTGLCYFHLGDYKKAEDFLLRAIPKIQKRNDMNALIASYMDLGNIYYEQYRDAQAIEYFERAYGLATKYGSFELKQNAALNMAIVEENRRNFEAATAYRIEYENWHDSLNDQNKIYDVAQLEKKFAVDKKQRRVQLLETENRLRQTERNMYLSAAALLLVILAFGIFLYRQNVKRSAIILAQKQELDVLNAVKDQLFSIVSHDLRSSVNALRTSNTGLKAQLNAGNYEKLDRQLDENSTIAAGTYHLLDNLLNWALLQTQGGYFYQQGHRLSMLADQVVFDFRALLKQRNMIFENLLPQSLKAFVDAESLKIVFRNFMDNSIKFSEDGALIRLVLLDETASEITVEWSDNGKGMNEETRLNLLSDSSHPAKKQHEEKLGSGLGIQLCRSMLKKNGGSLNIISDERSGTKMIVTLKKIGQNGAD